MAQQRTCAYYLKNACTRGATCPYAHTDRKTTKFAPAPTQSAKPCLHFQRGTCKFGSKCPLRHSTPHSVRPDGVAERVSVKASDDDDAFCVFFAAGQCARGDACNFSHSVRYGPSSAPPRSRVCKFWGQGACKNGTTCPYQHEAEPSPSTSGGHRTTPTTSPSDDGESSPAHLSDNYDEAHSTNPSHPSTPRLQVETYSIDDGYQDTSQPHETEGLASPSASTDSYHDTAVKGAVARSLSGELETSDKAFTKDTATTSPDISPVSSQINTPPQTDGGFPDTPDGHDVNAPDLVHHVLHGAEPSRTDSINHYDVSTPPFSASPFNDELQPGAPVVGVVGAQELITNQTPLPVDLDVLDNVSVIPAAAPAASVLYTVEPEADSIYDCPNDEETFDKQVTEGGRNSADGVAGATQISDNLCGCTEDVACDAHRGVPQDYTPDFSQANQVQTPFETSFEGDEWQKQGEEQQSQEYHNFYQHNDEEGASGYQPDGSNPPQPAAPVPALHWSEYADPYADATISFCKFLIKGHCREGDACRFRHAMTIQEHLLLFRDLHPILWTRTTHSDAAGYAPPPPSTAPVCIFYSQGKCRNGEACPYAHVLPEQQREGSSAAERWGSRRIQKPCKYLTERGFCTKGDACQFRHDSLSADGWSNQGGDGGSQADNAMAASVKEADAHASPTDGWSNQGEGDGGSQADNAVAAPVEEADAHGWGTPDGGVWLDESVDTTTTAATAAAANEWGVPETSSRPQEPGRRQNKKSSVESSSSRTPRSKNFGQPLRGRGIRGKASKYTHKFDQPRGEYRADPSPATEESTVEGGGWSQPLDDDATWLVPWEVPKPAPCAYFARGRCNDGDRCRYDHGVKDHVLAEPGDVPNEETDTFERSAPASERETPYAGFHTDDPSPFGSLRSHSPVEGEGDTLEASDVAEGSSSRNESDGHEDESSPPEAIGDQVSSLGSQEDDEETWTTAWSNPIAEPAIRRQINAPCKFFGQGYCVWGDQCLYKHIAPELPGFEAQIMKGTTRSRTPASSHDRAESPTDDSDDGHTEAEAFDVKIAGAGAPIVEINDVESIDQTADIDAIRVKPDVISYVDADAEDDDPAIERSMFNCTVRFGSGLSPEHVTTASDSCRVILSHLPPEMSQDDVVKLAKSFSAFRGIDLDNQRTSLSATIQYAHSDQAAAAVRHFNGQTLQVTAIAARLDTPFAIVSGKSPLVSSKVRVSWPVQTFSAWAFYPSITLAKAEGLRLDGSTYDGRKIKAAYISPKKKQAHSFAVQITGLPSDVQQDALRSFCPGTSLLELDRLTYTTSPIDNIRLTLEDFGPLKNFDVLPTVSNQSRDVGFTEYTSEAVARLAVGLNGSKKSFLGNGTLLVQQVYHTKYRVSARQFQATAADLDRLREKYGDECKFSYHGDTDPVWIHLHAQLEKREIFGQAHAEFDSLLQGEILMCDGKGLWDEYFDSPSSARALDNINSTTTHLVKCDPRTQKIRICGSKANRERAGTLILKLLKKVHSQRHIIPLQRTSLHALINGGLTALHDELGASKITLDVSVPALTVRGGEDVLQKVHLALDSYTTTQDNPGPQKKGACPICLYEPVVPVELPCRHIYCTGCLQRLLAGPNAAASPLRCVARTLIEESEGGQCPVYMPYATLRDLLPMADETIFLEASLLIHARAHEEEYFFCPTIGCEAIFRPGQPESVLQCPSCFTNICSYCAVSSHEGLTCGERSAYVPLADQ